MKLLRGVMISGLVHAFIFGAAFGFVAWRAHAGQGIDIDLAGSSLLLRPANPNGQFRPATPPQPWILAGKGRAAPPPVAQPVTQVAEAEAGAACPPPCPENDGDWLPAAAASRPPVWSEGIITEDDYPQELKRKGIEGKVVVRVLIDSRGVVRSAKIEEGSEPQFNDLVLERLKQSKFRPAFDQEGNPVATRFRIPLKFMLRN